MTFFNQCVELLRKVHEIRQLGIVSFDVRPRNTLVEDINASCTMSPLTGVSGQFQVKLLDFAGSRPFDFPSAAVLNKAVLAQSRAYDINKYVDLIEDVCGYREGGECPPYAPTRRMCEFLKWLHKYHAHEQCVQDFWPILSTRILKQFK